MSYVFRSFQFVYFINKFAINDTVSFCQNIIKRTGNLFSAKPTLWPLPDGVPPEIPRIQMAGQRQDSKASLSVSHSRADLIIHDTAVKFDEKSFDKTFLHPLRNITEVLLSEHQLAMNRLGCVINANLDVSDPLKYMREEILGKGQGILESHAILQSRLSMLEILDWRFAQVNRWLRISANQSEESKPLEFLLDFNTLPERELNVDTATTIDFAERVKKYVFEHLPTLTGKAK